MGIFLGALRFWVSHGVLKGMDSRNMSVIKETTESQVIVPGCTMAKLYYAFT